jgi:hypothetical protein
VYYQTLVPWQRETNHFVHDPIAHMVSFDRKTMDGGMKFLKKRPNDTLGIYEESSVFRIVSSCVIKTHLMS